MGVFYKGDKSASFFFDLSSRYIGRCFGNCCKRVHWQMPTDDDLFINHKIEFKEIVFKAFVISEAFQNEKDNFYAIDAACWAQSLHKPSLLANFKTLASSPSSWWTLALQFHSGRLIANFIVLAIFRVLDCSWFPEIAHIAMSVGQNGKLHRFSS